MTTQTTVSELKINKLTKQQYDNITPNPTELYMIIDDSGITSSDITTALGYTPTQKILVTNGALTQTGGVCTWSITNTIGGYANVQIYEVSSGEEVDTYVSVTTSIITIKINSASNISANTYRAVIQG